MFKINAYPINNPGNSVIGLCSIVVNDSLKMDSIRVIKSDKAARGFFLAMPAYKTSKRNSADKEVYKSLFHSTDRSFTEELENAVSTALETGESVEISRDTAENIGIKVDPVKSDNMKDNGIKAKVTVFISSGTDDNKVKMVIDSFSIKEYAKKDNEKKLFISAPSRKTSDGEYKNVCYPLTADFRENFYGRIFTEYHTQIDKLAKNDYEKTVLNRIEKDGLNI